uniref:Uncharacterized protein n=1 Tax=Ciona intestinalis TaxID=7719 RepID=H2Y266_CIOIN
MNKSALLLLLLIGLLVLTETTTAWWSKVGRRRGSHTPYDELELSQINEIPDMESEDGFIWYNGQE